MVGRSKLEEIIVFTYIKYALCFSWECGDSTACRIDERKFASFSFES